jgi:baseplate J-like protein
MDLQLFCTDEGRKAKVRAHPSINGIEYLEVLDDEAPPGVTQQRTLLLHCLKPVTGLMRENVRIEGGVRVTGINVLWAFPANNLPADEVAELAPVVSRLDDPASVLVVRTDASGDFSTYTLRLVRSRSEPAVPPPSFDRVLASVEFSFKVDCDSSFDCRRVDRCAEPSARVPQIDYLAKDYASFRRLMLDRLSLLIPAWHERNPADTGVALVELLAYAADRLSYYQDAAATEAYLGTARRRTSVRRHARLLDYFMHEGANARVWITLTVTPYTGADGAVLRGPSVDRHGTQFLTQANEQLAALDGSKVEGAITAGVEVFESMHDVTLRAEHNEMHFYTWGDEECCLPKGATKATLRRFTPGGHRDGEFTLPSLVGHLAPGDILILEEVRGLSGAVADADPAHRHAVRLTAVEYIEDPLVPEDDYSGRPTRLVEIEWAAQDALPFPLCLKNVPAQDEPDQPMSVVRGNVVLADHGRTIEPEPLPAPATPDPNIPVRLPFRPVLQRFPITQQGQIRDRNGELAAFDPAGPAVGVFDFDLRDAQPAVELREVGNPSIRWGAQRDVLASGRFTPDFVVEIENDGRAQLRFGDGVLGRQPVAGLIATYRIGNGLAGNVGADAIAHAVTSIDGIEKVRNPLPARGGSEPELAEQVKLYAPEAFRTQERAVTESDYIAAAERHSDVQRAAATRRWTGSWYTMFVTIDRKGGRAVDGEFEATLRGHLERFRLAGYDLEIDAPRFVALEIGMLVCVEAGYFRSDVAAALMQAFSASDFPGGRGFFHPDNFSFGQPVYLSNVVAAAMRVPGVAWVKVETFKRWGKLPQGEREDGQISMSRLEIARLDQDPNAPENGRIEFRMQGGL